MDQDAGTTGIPPSEHRCASTRAGAPRPAAWSPLSRVEGAVSGGPGDALRDQGEDLRRRCLSSARLAPTSPGLPRPEGRKPRSFGLRRHLCILPPRLGPSRRPCSRRLCQERGRSRAAGGPDGRAARSGATFSGFQKEHFLSCLIFSSFKCK